MLIGLHMPYGHKPRDRFPVALASVLPLIDYVYLKQSGKLLKGSVRLIAGLPTLITGNAVVLLAQRIGFTPQGWVQTLLYTLGCLVIIALPMVLHVGSQMLNAVPERAELTELMEAAEVDGAQPEEATRMLLMPSRKRELGVVTTIAISRVFVEAYIVLDRSILQGGQPEIFSDPQTFLETLHSLYSTMTIEANIPLIIILFILAMAANVWISGVLNTHRVS
jgi:ABC-type phosphate transport system permease subunit